MSTRPGDDWHVLPHGPIEKLADNLWWVQGSLRGMSLKRVMTVARRTDGKLVIHSAIAMSEDAMGELEALGEPAFLVVPSRGPPPRRPRIQEEVPGAARLCAAWGTKGHRRQGADRRHLRGFPRR